MNTQTESETVSAGAPAVVSLPVFHSSPEYRRLTAKQKQWIDVYVLAQDPEAATQAAYTCSTEHYAKLLSYSVLRNRHIRAALDKYFNRTAKDRDLLEIERRMRKAKKGSDAERRLFEMKIFLTYGFQPSEAAGKLKADDLSPETPAAKADTVRETVRKSRVAVGDIIRRTKDGVARRERVLAIDESGKPVQVEEVVEGVSDARQ
jgi:hypothetical protein